MQGNRKAWPNMLLALFCKKFRNLLPVSFIIQGNSVSRKFSVANPGYRAQGALISSVLL
jgi:hypothetical protein